jgi:hypothetical protein
VNLGNRRRWRRASLLCSRSCVTVAITVSMRVLLSVAFLLTALPSFAAEFDPFAGPTPIFVYIQTDPWAMILGSDTPRIALYEDGELIFQSKVDQKFVYRHHRLDAVQLHQFQQQLAPLAGLKHLRYWYNISPNATHQPETKFYLRDEAGERTTQIYGLMDVSGVSPKYLVVGRSPRAKRGRSEEGPSVNLGKSHQNGFADLRRLSRTISRCASVCCDSQTDSARRVRNPRESVGARWVSLNAGLAEDEIAALGEGVEGGVLARKGLGSGAKEREA